MIKLKILVRLIIIFVLSVIFLFFFLREKIKNDLQFIPPENIRKEKIKESIVQTEKKASVFVPYWVEIDELKTFDKYLYFGLAVNETGVDYEDPGYKNMDNFLKSTVGLKKSLVIRMTNNTENLNILDNEEIQKIIAIQSADTALSKGFEEVVLDLEISAIPFDTLVEKINNFVQIFSKEVKKKNLHFSMTTYGDNFYRARPFRIKILNNFVDEFYIMAYDFHKSGGINPGPNFPLDGHDEYGYDFKKMIDDYMMSVERSKITVVFGLYGYDWEVNENNKSLHQATAISYNDIKRKFLSKCSFDRCVIGRDKVSSETRIEYVDNKVRHIIWFEDMESAKKKQEYLSRSGISSISYWAYSYF